jgi:hypothetical protein
MHAPDSHLGIEISDCALQVQRPVADAGRWAAPDCRASSRRHFLSPAATCDLEWTIIRQIHEQTSLRNVGLKA